jgi:hypothetical protein
MEKIQEFMDQVVDTDKIVEEVIAGVKQKFGLLPNSEQMQYAITLIREKGIDPIDSVIAALVEAFPR